MIGSGGRLLHARNADRLFVPASTAKLTVGAALTGLLPSDYRVVTSTYANGQIEGGVLSGDLIAHGRGDPSFPAHCYDTLAAGLRDSLWTRMDLLANQVVASGLGEVSGTMVGDGSYFEAAMVHLEWEMYA